MQINALVLNFDAANSVNLVLPALDTLNLSACVLGLSHFTHKSKNCTQLLIYNYIMMKIQVTNSYTSKLSCYSSENM